MNKKKGFLRFTLVLSIIVGVLSGVIGYISEEQKAIKIVTLEQITASSKFQELSTQDKTLLFKNYFTKRIEPHNKYQNLIPEEQESLKIKYNQYATELATESKRDLVVPKLFNDIIKPVNCFYSITIGILWLIIGFISVWTIYGFIRWCIINLATWIIAGFKASQ